MSIDFSVLQIDWEEFQAALAEGSVADPFWENEFAFDSEDAWNDPEVGYILNSTECYCKLRPHLPDEQRRILDEVIGEMLWNSDVDVPTDPPFAAAINRCDVTSFRGSAQFLLSPKSVVELLQKFEQVDFDALRAIAKESLAPKYSSHEDVLGRFRDSDEFVDYVAAWRDNLRDAASNRCGLIAIVAI
jgi:hypothetical protein